MKKNKAVFFDRDGVLNDILVEDDGYVRSPRTLEEFNIKEGVAELLSKIKELGYLVVVITSQPEVKRGLVDLEVVESMNGLLRSELPIDDLVMCLHDNEDNCDCRKPKPGMLYEAAKKWDIDLEGSLMVGDTAKDVGAGRAAGCMTILVNTNYNEDVHTDARVEDIREVSDFL